MTRPDIEAIAARAKAATEGPWKANGSWIVCYSDDVDLAGYLEPDDATFIAAARTDIPDLIRYVLALEAEKTLPCDRPETAACATFLNLKNRCEKLEAEVERLNRLLQAVEKARKEERNAQPFKAKSFDPKPDEFDTTTSPYKEYTP